MQQPDTDRPARTTEPPPGPGTAAPWQPVRGMTTAQVVADHEGNPEYEVHVGRRVAADDGERRYVSLWLQGRRFHGWLTAGEPGAGPSGPA